MGAIQPQAIQKFMENLLDCPVCEVKALGSGATSTAWLVSCDSDQYIFRATQRTTNRPVTYRSEFLILRQLREQGLPVPVPLYHSFDQTSDFDEHISAWAITRVIAGNPIQKRSLTYVAASQLGDFLRVLHQLPCSNFGRLDEQSKNLRGQQISPIDGIRDRWCWAQLWPYDDSILVHHPIAIIAPELLNALANIEVKLWSIATQQGDAVVNHSDLHGEHIFTSDEILSGVIDFGAAFIASRSWDFAVLAYYHGWATVEVILKRYAQNETQYRHLLQHSLYLAVVVGLYKLEKAFTARSEVNRQRRAVEFITQTLSLSGN